MLRENGQCGIADRYTNPDVQWVHRFYRKWRIEVLGSENGKNLFEKLEQEVEKYNECYGDSGGCAKMQWYSIQDCDVVGLDSKDAGDECHQPPAKRKKRCKEKVKPFILAACTPLMARVHRNVMQSAEIVFCDATASLDRYNTALFILSTCHPAGGLPLGVVMISDEKEESITKGFQLLMETIPSDSFIRKGDHGGPTVVMTDDSNTEKHALKTVWPNAVQLLCIFHFLQRRWTWLYEGKNKISNQDKSFLLSLIKEMVYAKTEAQLEKLYEEFKCHRTVLKYTNFINHINALWPKRKEWALCFCTELRVRGNHTNNISEAGVRIVKEIVFSRVKAYNLVELFQFVVEKMECYYQRRLLSVAHNRIDRYIQVKYRGLNAGKIQKEHIKSCSENSSSFFVKSRRDPDSEYHVDMTLGICTCPAGMDGSPCSHQSAVALHFRVASLNTIPTLQPECRRQLAYIAVGEKAVSFYSSVSQFQDETHQPLDCVADVNSNGPLFRSNIEFSDDGMPNAEVHVQEESIVNDRVALSNELESIFEDLKQRLNDDDPQLCSGMKKFIARYNTMSESHGSIALLASAFHCFGSQHNSPTTISYIQGGGHIRRGRRIPVEATASGRRKYGSKGKASAIGGRPPIGKNKENKQSLVSRYQLPIRSEPKGKRPHNLRLSVVNNTQNAGKW